MADKSKNKRVPGTSLEKSHSGASNLKLTLLCILSELSFAALFVGAAFAVSGKPVDMSVALITAGAGALVSAVCIVLLYRFKR